MKGYLELSNTIYWEGLNQALLFDSTWSNIEDKEFHILRDMSLIAIDNLQQYVAQKFREYGIKCEDLEKRND